ncbi:unnamed protein product, partial [Iphiclides podalirius]
MLEASLTMAVVFGVRDGTHFQQFAAGSVAVSATSAVRLYIHTALGRSERDITGSEWESNLPVAKSIALLSYWSDDKHRITWIHPFSA